jgi:hypothetical protein
VAAFAQTSHLSHFWLRFAHFASDSGARRSQIGFVLHNLLDPAPPAAPNWVRFACFTPDRATPHTATTSAHIPHSTQVWLRFAQFLPSSACGRTELGSFRTIPMGEREVRGLKSEAGMAGPSDLTLQTGNSPHEDTTEFPFHSWEWCDSLLMTVSDRRHPRRLHLHI